jgi:hypothetical protein
MRSSLRRIDATKRLPPDWMRSPAGYLTSDRFGAKRIARD